MNPKSFLELLWGVQPPGLIQAWELARRRATYFASTSGTVGLAGQVDVYTCVALGAKRHPSSRRPHATDAVGITGLWLDLDVDGGPDRKTGAIPTRPIAEKLACHVLEPTVIVDSGYGLHAWYLLDEPWMFRTVAERDDAATASAQWYQLHRHAAQHVGGGLDHTHDLARLMRLPGTFNGKGGLKQPVTLVHADGPRRTLGDLRAAAAAAGPVEVSWTSDPATGGAAPDIVVRGNGLNTDRLAVLFENSPEFADTFHHRLGARARHWSLSEHDLALCSLGAQAGLSDQELADLVVTHRRHHEPADRKALRRDYLQRTIARARDTSSRGSAAERLRQRAYGKAA